MTAVTAPAPAKSSQSILPAATTIGTVTLRVADAERSLRWYRDMMGLQLIERSPGRLVLGGGGQPFLILEVRPGAAPRDENTTGLYHVAILVPDRPTLGGVLARIAAAGVRLGASDHLVSEALYIWDPDNNGLEIYRDRPRNEWQWDGREVRMATDPLDLRNLGQEGIAAGKEREPMPAGTRIGHVHLQVGDIEKAGSFYCDVLGFAKMAGRHGALFVSAGGYHHHIGMNIWHSRNALPPAENAAGLVIFEVVVPDRAALAATKARLEAAGFETKQDGDGFQFRDPWQIAVRVIPARD
ncbi:MAG: VOC family protein [Xanthobacteraceae bacterium]